MPSAHLNPPAHSAYAHLANSSSSPARVVAAQAAAAAPPAKPAILIVPEEHDPSIGYENIAKLKAELDIAKPGDSFVFPYPIRIYHQIDGFWVESRDLAAMVAPPGLPLTEDDDGVNDEDDDEDDDD